MTKFNHFEQLENQEHRVALPPEFPVSAVPLYEQNDQDITVLHYHSCLEIGYCYEGSGIFVIEDQIYPFQAGDASLIHQGRIHLAQSTKGTSSKWRFLSLDASALTAYFDPDQRQLFGDWQQQGKSQVLRSDAHGKTIQLIHDIINEVVLKHAHYQTLTKLKLGALVMQSLRDEKATPALRKEFNQRTFQRILPAIQTMMRNYAQPIKIEDLAQLCHLSQAQFRKLFLAAMDTSPQSYLISIRLNHADQLLQNTHLKIADVAQQVGFPTLSSFNRAFQLTRQRTPKASRTPAV